MLWCFCEVILVGFAQGDFDLVGGARSLAEAEVIKVGSSPLNEQVTVVPFTTMPAIIRSTVDGCMLTCLVM